MAVHITEAELARDVHAVLEKVRAGAEVIVEQDHRPVAIIRTPSPGRNLDESITLAEAHERQLGHAPLMDTEFARDIQAAINAHREPLDPPTWD